MPALNAIKILPPISKALVSAVQLGLDEVWTGEGSLAKPWSAYALPCAWLRPREFATLQTNSAASLEASELTVFNVCREVTRMAVAKSSGWIQIYREEVVPCIFDWDDCFCPQPARCIFSAALVNGSSVVWNAYALKRSGTDLSLSMPIMERRSHAMYFNEFAALLDATLS